MGRKLGYRALFEASRFNRLFSKSIGTRDFDLWYMEMFSRSDMGTARKSAKVAIDQWWLGADTAPQWFHDVFRSNDTAKTLIPLHVDSASSFDNPMSELCCRSIELFVHSHPRLRRSGPAGLNLHRVGPLANDRLGRTSFAYCSPSNALTSCLSHIL